MTCSSILRRSASRAARLAARVSGSRGHKHPTIASNSYSSVRCIPLTSSPPSSDKKLLRVVQSEIVVVKQFDWYDKNVEVPNDFPFEVEDNVGEQTMTITRVRQ